MAGTATATAGTQTATATSAVPVAAASYTVTLLDDTTSSVSDDFDVADYLGTPTWAQMVAAFGRGYRYPGPGSNATSYRTGDESSIETSTFASIRAAESLKMCQQLADYWTLANTNSFGNTSRFTSDDGTEFFDGTTKTVPANNYVIDHYSGLGWFLTGQTGATWNNAIDNALAATEVSFSDWFLPSLWQYFSVVNTANTWPAADIIGGTSVWTSTTSEYATTSAAYMNSSNRIGMARPKTNTHTFYLCRKHF